MGYKPEYADLARRVCLIFSFTDEELAWFFEIDIGQLAWWAWEHKEFFDAITPTAEERQKYSEQVRLRKERTNAQKRHKRAINPSERLRNAVSARMWAALRGRSDGRLFSRLGYSVQELRVHLEGQFHDGMSWDNYGKWHVDHRRPCSSFNLAIPEEFNACWSLSNLQPLWASENISKGARWGEAS